MTGKAIGGRGWVPAVLAPLKVAVERVAALLPTRTDLVVAGRHRRQNLIAGITVAIVALPLALAFGVASGLGARAGLATAVVAGAIAAVFGGSNPPGRVGRVRHEANGPG